MAIYTQNGTKIEEGVILQDVKISPADKNPNDAIGWVDKFAIIVKGASMSPNSTMLANIRIDRVKDKFAFASIV